MNDIIEQTQEPAPYLKIGGLYKLKDLQRNKIYTHMAAYRQQGSEAYRLAIADPNYAKHRHQLYTDGDMFVCLSLTKDPAYAYKGAAQIAYVLLAPDGTQVLMAHYQNKGKFESVK